jgi:hypothetical protein
MSHNEHNYDKRKIMLRQTKLFSSFNSLVGKKQSQLRVHTRLQPASQPIELQSN